MKEFVRAVCGLIEQEEPFVLATVVESSGSTPRSAGAKMAVRRDGSILGSVGGGLVEAMACRDGQKMVDEPDTTSRLIFVDMTQELAANSDMICGGGLSVLLETVAPGGECALAYRKVNDLMRTGRESVLSTSFEGGEAPRSIKHEVLANISSAPTMSKVAGNDACTVAFEKTGNEMVLIEPFIPPAPLYIFGAGHVSLFTARVGAMVGFRTVVLDDRGDFANRERFPEADEVVILPSLENCCDSLDVGEDAFIVVVTRGHLHDRNVLAEALRTKAKYVGMIGSKKKRDKIYDSLLSDGFTQADIDRCHCPIGLTIGAQTPEEIAVSICAELIQVRARLKA